jgi:glycosyltransferase involved in cell wall biosynthesis
MAELVQRVAAEWKPEYVVALTFVTAPYALLVQDVPRVLDVDNFMTRMLYEAYALEDNLLSKARRWLAYKKFEDYEKLLCPQFDHCLVVTEEDRKSLADLADLGPNQINVVSNGVDTSHHQAFITDPEPNTLIYNGALTYDANFDAMQYFLSAIFPQIVAQLPEVKLRITGKTDGVPIEQLPLTPQVEFTGYLEDIRPAVARSWACPVPLRIGGGTRLKILEAMALGTPVISTSKGAEGLEVEDGKHLLIADTPQDFAAHTVWLLRDKALREHLTNNAMQLIGQKYEWEIIGREFASILEK